MTATRFSGVLVPVLTPFKVDLSPDRDRFVKICRWILAHGATGLAPFGTTSEANSMAVEERMELLEALVDNGIPGDKLMPGAGTCNLTDNVKIARHAVKLGCRGILMLPPFYYKNMSDEGMFAMFSESIQRIGSADLQVYLYHIPPQTVTGISLKLIEML
uniref:dihydrodipicolinate synthase family protein n=1 Tax=Shumkonia mesophila TaxID=2838854 RepID=UPI0029352BF1